MGGGKERSGHLSAKEKLHIKAQELLSQQLLGTSINDRVGEELESSGELDVGALLMATRRFERARTDALWLQVIIAKGVKRKTILSMVKIKDELSRTVDGNHEE